MSDPRPPLFRVLTEIGIIDQLATAALAKRLPEGVHPTQFGLLSHMMRQGDGERPADLARAFQVPKASMTNTLMQLAKRDLIEMRPNAQDARSKLVYLTPAGRTLFQQTVQTLIPAMAGLGQQIDGLEDILPVLEQLRRALDQNRDA